MSALQTVTLITAIIGAVCGLAGTILGILNTWNAINQNRVRLKVIPKLVYWVSRTRVIRVLEHSDEDTVNLDAYPRQWCVEVVNLSSFAITISLVGFGRNTQIPGPRTIPEKEWPTRLEPRESVAFLSPEGDKLPACILEKPEAFAETDCGVRRYGTSPVLREYVREVRKSPQEETA